jgi:hypothetical protein
MTRTEGRASEAEPLLREAAEISWCALCPLPDLARARDAKGDAPGAIEAYKQYLSTPWFFRYKWTPTSWAQRSGAWPNCTMCAVNEARRRKREPGCSPCGAGGMPNSSPCSPIFGPASCHRIASPVLRRDQ